MARGDVRYFKSLIVVIFRILCFKSSVFSAFDRGVGHGSECGDIGVLAVGVSTADGD